MSVTRKHNRIVFNYSINSSILDHVGDFKDLGVVVDSTLSWRQNIESIIAKTKRVCGMIKRSVGYNAPVSVTCQLYNTLARCNLEYCSSVWSPHYARDIRAIESLQRGMTKYILKFPDNSYVDRCVLLEMLPLCYRREISDLLFFHKCLYRTYDVELVNFVSFVPTHTVLRSAHQGILLRRQLVSTESFKADYFNRIVGMWNCLPQCLRDCDNFNTFKAGVICNYKSKLVTQYDPYNSSTWRTV